MGQCHSGKAVELQRAGCKANVFEYAEYSSIGEELNDQ